MLTSSMWKTFFVFCSLVPRILRQSAFHKNANLLPNWFSSWPMEKMNPYDGFNWFHIAAKITRVPYEKEKEYGHYHWTVVIYQSHGQGPAPWVVNFNGVFMVPNKVCYASGKYAEHDITHFQLLRNSRRFRIHSLWHIVI